MSLEDFAREFTLVDISNLVGVSGIDGLSNWQIVTIRERWRRTERGLYRSAGCAPIGRLFLNFQVKAHTRIVLIVLVE